MVPAPKGDLGEFFSGETRFEMLRKLDPDRAKFLLENARAGVKSQFSLYEKLSKL